MNLTELGGMRMPLATIEELSTMKSAFPKQQSLLTLPRKKLVKKLLKKYLPAISSTDETILNPSSVHCKNGTTLRQRLSS